jgi:hypothetical protein
MRHLRVIYDGREYAGLPGRSADEIRAEIAAAVGEGRTIWLPVMHGERRGIPGTLLIGPGTQVAVLDAVDDDLPVEASVADGEALVGG